jgi:hypothetical protein
MFLYTICPGCQAGYDVTNMLAGKKLRCKSCARPFQVAAVARPRHLPPLAPFMRPQAPAAATAITAQSSSGFEQAKPIASTAAITRSGRPYERLPRAPQRPPTGSNAGSWLGRGGLSAGAILAFLLLRGCIAMTSTRTNYAPTYTPPKPVVIPQQQWNDPNNNGQFNPNNNWQGGQNPNGGFPRKGGKKGNQQPGGGVGPDNDKGRPPIGDDDKRDPDLERRDDQLPPGQKGVAPKRED